MKSWSTIFRDGLAGASRLVWPALLVLMFLSTFLHSFVASAQTVSPLVGPPLGERWFGIFFNDDRTGFAHVTVKEAPTGYQVASDSSVKMAGFGFSREASVRERYLVGKDLSLQSFRVTQTIDGSPMELVGRVSGKIITLTVESKGNRTEKILPVKGTVYPPAVLNIYPLFRTVKAGTELNVAMFDPEAVTVKEVTITVVGFESIDGGTALHLRNNLYPFVDNDIWVDLSGNTIRESVRDGWIETRAESAADARAFLSEAAITKKDLLVDFSLVPVDRSIERPAELVGLALELSGVAEDLPLLTSPVQKAERLDGAKVLFTIDNSLLQAPETMAVEESLDMKPYLEATDRILADNPEIFRVKTEILCGTEDPRKAVEKLVRWVADTVKDTITDSQSPLETLAKGSGNCQSHARLYASLARAAGIPTRYVSGIVYAEGKGFLYHSWAESYVGYWLPVDPTFREVPANPTHIKLAEGDSPADLAPLAAIIGAIRARVLDLKYKTGS